MTGTSELDAIDELLPTVQQIAALPARPRRRSLWQMLRFGIVGVFNTLIDIFALNTMLWRFPSHNADLLLLENSIACAIAALNSFAWNKYWTFRQRKALTATELARFALVTIAGFLCNDGMVWMVGSILHPLIANPFLWANLSKASAVIGTIFISYVGMRFWVFESDPQAGVRHPKT